MSLQNNQHEVWYDEDRADEAAMALLWVTAFQEGGEGAWHTSRELAGEILARLAQRGVVHGSSGNDRLALTEWGRFRCQQAFEHLIGKAIPATIEPAPRTHLVEEIDGE